MAIVVAPLLVGLAAVISPKTVTVNLGIRHLYAISWLFGYPTSIFLYWFFNFVSPHHESMVPKTISGVPDFLDAESAGSVHSGSEVVQGGKLQEKVTVRDVTSI
jgi:hypothetical protein